MQRTAAETREHVLSVAAELFYSQGIRATGVDAVAAQAGVAPTTLYRLFPSKDDLVGAYVERSERDFWDHVPQPDLEPREQILALFEAAGARCSSEQYRGCVSMMALAEFADPALPAHREAVAAKARVRKRIGDLTAKLDVADPAELADHLTLVWEGLYASSQALGPDGPAKRARGLAAAILAAAG